MGTSPLQGNGVSAEGERTRLACSLRRPVEDMFERWAFEIGCPAGRRTSLDLKPLDLDLSGLGKNYDIVVICRGPACVLRSRIHDPGSGIVSAVDKTESNRIPFRERSVWRENLVRDICGQIDGLSAELNRGRQRRRDRRRGAHVHKIGRGTRQRVGVESHALRKGTPGRCHFPGRESAVVVPGQLKQAETRIAGIATRFDHDGREGVMRKGILPGKREDICELVAAGGEGVCSHGRERADRKPGKRGEDRHDREKFNQRICATTTLQSGAERGSHFSGKGDERYFGNFLTKCKKSFACIVYVFNAR